MGPTAANLCECDDFINNLPNNYIDIDDEYGVDCCDYTYCSDYESIDGAVLLFDLWISVAISLSILSFL